MIILRLSSLAHSRISACSTEDIVDALQSTTELAPLTEQKLFRLNASLPESMIVLSQKAEFVFGRRKRELDYSDELSKKLKGKREVRCAVGRIDVLTKDLCIEVKYGYGWKAALGQVLAYSCFVVQRPALALIGPYPKQYVHNVCKKYKVEIIDI